MMLTREEVTTVTVRCATCKAEIKSAEDATAHARRHTMEQLHSTPEGLRYLQMYRCTVAIMMGKGCDLIDGHDGPCNVYP